MVVYINPLNIIIFDVLVKNAAALIALFVSQQISPILLGILLLRSCRWGLGMTSLAACAGVEVRKKLKTVHQQLEGIT